MSSSTSHQQQPTTNTFGGPDADLTTRLLQQNTTQNNNSSPAAEQARRRTSEWKPSMPGRTFSFDHEEHKHAMMAASGALSSTSSSHAEGGDAEGQHGFTERGA